MAQQNLRLNVTASQFPFLSDQEGQTTIVSGNDTYYVRPNQFTGETADKNIGIPQMTFVENVMPTSYGYQSVGYQAATVEFPGSLDDADQLIYLRGVTGRRYLLNFNRTNGRGYVYSTEIAAWILLFNISELPSQAYVCLVKGRCFIAFKNFGAMFEFKDYNSFTHNFDMIVYTGFGGISDLTPIFGIVSANNYFILFTRTEIFYTIPSELYGVVPDFTPSLGPTGAAVETPSVLKGIILTCLPTQDGFFIFTSTNIVAAFYSGNIKFPWTYRELEGSAAISDLDSVAKDRDEYPKYVMTGAGLLKIGKSSCTPVFVEAAEFLGNSTYEQFDWNSKLITRIVSPNPLHIGMSYIANRWLVLSYGEAGALFQFAIIYDEHLKRWGKLQITHARVVEFFGIPATLQPTPGLTYQDLLNAGYTYQALFDLGYTYAFLGGTDFGGNPDIALEYRSIGLISSKGVVNLVDFDLSTVSNLSVAILGRVQLSRSHRFKVISLWLENLQTDPVQEQTKVAILSSNDGKNTSRTEYGYSRLNNSGGLRKYQYARSEGINLQIQVEGDFQLSTVIVVGFPTGSAYR